YDVLADKANPNHPELAVVIGDPFNLKRAVFLYQQIRDMGVPAIFVVNMIDEAERAGLSIDVRKLEHVLATKVILTDARSGKGIDDLKAALSFKPGSYPPSFRIPQEYHEAIQQVKDRAGVADDY